MPKEEARTTFWLLSGECSKADDQAEQQQQALLVTQGKEVHANERAT